MKPTEETYSELQTAYDTFNRLLFGGQLPDCIITLQRNKNTQGYFSEKRFTNRHGAKVDEIAMNPTYFAVFPLIETMGTLCHEQHHLWQAHFGKPGRGRYHNVEWANKMESNGLMPSSTGQPGGARTGDYMADYAIEGGRFLTACDVLITQDFKISWYDRFAPHIAMQAGQKAVSLSLDLSDELSAIPTDDGVEISIEQVNKSNRSKYSCGCEINVWGKPGLHLICGECKKTFAEVNI